MNLTKAEEVEIRVSVTKAILVAAFEQATREGRSSVELIRERIERPSLLADKAKLEDFSNAIGGVRPKRRDGGLWQWEKLVVAVPLKLKCELMRIAREQRISQNELGLVIVQGAVRDETWLGMVLRLAAEAKSAASE